MKNYLYFFLVLVFVSCEIEPQQIQIPSNYHGFDNRYNNDVCVGDLCYYASEPTVNELNDTSIIITYYLNEEMTVSDYGIAISRIYPDYGTTIPYWRSQDFDYIYITDNPFAEVVYTKVGHDKMYKIDTIAAAISNLDPSTKYYCRLFVDINYHTYLLDFTTTSSLTLKTGNIIELTSTSAEIQGEVVSLKDNKPVLQHGHCWSATVTAPTINSSNPLIDVTSLGGKNSTGTFISELKDLSPNTTYYIRAYAFDEAINGKIYYGETVVFTTMP